MYLLDGIKLNFYYTFVYSNKLFKCEKAKVNMKFDNYESLYLINVFIKINSFILVYPPVLIPLKQ